MPGYNAYCTYGCVYCRAPLRYLKYQNTGYHIGNCHYFVCTGCGKEERIWEHDEETFEKLKKIL